MSRGLWGGEIYERICGRVTGMSGWEKIRATDSNCVITTRMKIEEFTYILVRIKTVYRITIILLYQ